MDSNGNGHGLPNGRNGHDNGNGRYIRRYFPQPVERVVITGIGAITPIGIGRTKLWAGVRAGRSAVQRIDRFDPTLFRSQVAAQVNDFEPRSFFDGKQMRRLDRFSQFALASAQMAVEDSGLDLSHEDPDRLGIYVGSALGGICHAEGEHFTFLQKGLRAVNPTLALAVFGGASSSNIAIELGIYGPNVANANSCASGVIALGEAFRALRYGLNGADVILAGGVEAPLAPLTFGAFDLIHVFSSQYNASPETASRPFDKSRDGFVIAEGGAVLVLETLSHAQRRGAHIYAEILGYGNSNDGYHMTAPRPDGRQAARTMQEAMAEAGWQPAQVDYVNAHASSTILNDKTETLAIKRALGERAYDIPISGTKGLHGHALGATGAMEVGLCAMMFEEEWLPPTWNLADPDPECDLDYIAPPGRDQAVNRILSNAFGFGGINATLALARFDEG